MLILSLPVGSSRLDLLLRAYYLSRPLYCPPKRAAMLSILGDL